MFLDAVVNNWWLYGKVLEDKFQLQTDKFSKESR